jgi:hypothetical protein
VTTKKEANPKLEHDGYMQKVEASLERARDDGFDELMEIMHAVIPAETLDEWENTYKDPRFIKVDIDRVCTRCGAVVYSGGKNQHKRWHKNMTFAMWMQQAGILSLMKEPQ